MRPISQPTVQSKTEIIKGPLGGSTISIANDTLENHFFTGDNRHIFRLFYKERVLRQSLAGGQVDQEAKEEKRFKHHFTLFPQATLFNWFRLSHKSVEVKAHPSPKVWLHVHSLYVWLHWILSDIDWGALVGFAIVKSGFLIRLLNASLSEVSSFALAPDTLAISCKLSAKKVLLNNTDSRSAADWESHDVAHQRSNDVAFVRCVFVSALRCTLKKARQHTPHQTIDYPEYFKNPTKYEDKCQKLYLTNASKTQSQTLCLDFFPGNWSGRQTE